MSQLGQGRVLDWWAEVKSWEMKGVVWSMGEERGGRRREWREVGAGGQRCSSIISHSGPGVGFSKTDSERSGLDSISHKSWHVTLMDVGHKAPCSDMQRATWRTMGKCECSRLMSTRPGSEGGDDGEKERRGHREIRGAERGIEKNEWAESRMWKSTETVGTRNRIYCDIAMIQLSSCGFKPMLLGLYWKSNPVCKRWRHLNIFPDTHFLIYFLISPKVGDKLHCCVTMFGKCVFCSLINSACLCISSVTVCLRGVWCMTKMNIAH